MKRSRDRILTTHAGSLPRPAELPALIQAKAAGDKFDQAELDRMLKASVADVVKHQVAVGLDSVNDGELSKTNFTNYVRERLSGFEQKSFPVGQGPKPMNVSARDMRDFPEYFEGRTWFGTQAPIAQAGGVGNVQAGVLPGTGVMSNAFAGPSMTQVMCTSPLKYVGHAALQLDIDNFRAALQGVKVEEPFLPANTPGTIEHWLRNEYYKSDEEFVYAIAEAMREEYEGIVNAGFLLQIDDPDLPDGWQMFPDMSVADYQKYAMVRVQALNHALRNIPSESVRLHVCWGSFHGPHRNDIPLKDIIGVILAVKADEVSIEASNAMHEHEWNVFETTKLPAGKTIIPGVIGHASDFIEHPELVAQRLERYARLVGPENVMAGTDCGLGGRVGHPSIAWAKFAAMAEGARIATKRLMGK